jgi:hypothetical protein
MLMSSCRLQHPVWRSHRSGAVYQATSHFSLQIEKRMNSKRKNSISVSRRKEVYPSRFQSGNALHIICPFISIYASPALPLQPSTHILVIQLNQYHLFSPWSTAPSRPSILYLYLAGGALNQQRHKQCFLALTWHPALPCHCLFANDEIIGRGSRINHETKPMSNSVSILHHHDF